MYTEGFALQLGSSSVQFCICGASAVKRTGNLQNAQMKTIGHSQKQLHSFVIVLVIPAVVKTCLDEEGEQQTKTGRTRRTRYTCRKKTSGET